MGKQNLRHRPRLHVGTSGWTYEDWQGSFYPLEIPKRRWLNWYATHFCCTEINPSFYRTPSIEAVQTWHDSTPANFRFAWKASKFITHWKRLSDKSENSLELMKSRLLVLGSKCGPVLFQLPRRFTAHRDRLAHFIKMLPRQYDYAFEFRHASWYEAPIISLLRENDIALCLSDHHHAPAPWISTASHVYVRGHGPAGDYRGRYSEATLVTWARKLRYWGRAGKQ